MTLIIPSSTGESVRAEPVVVPSAPAPSAIPERAWSVIPSCTRALESFDDLGEGARDLTSDRIYNWRHGWVPLTPEALAVKLHKAHGHAGDVRDAHKFLRSSGVYRSGMRQALREHSTIGGTHLQRAKATAALAQRHEDATYRHLDRGHKDRALASAGHAAALRRLSLRDKRLHGVDKSDSERLEEVRSQMRREAAATKARAGADIEALGIEHRMGKQPKDSTGGEYDFLERLSPAERYRLNASWFIDSPDAPRADEVAHIVQSAIPNIATHDEAMQHWLKLTRRYDAAGRLARGKLPADRRYGDLNVDHLVPGDYKASIVFGDRKAALAHIDAVDKERKARLDAEAEARQERPLPMATHGADPADLTFEQYHEELSRLEDEFSRAVPVSDDPEWGPQYNAHDREILARLDELAPPEIDPNGTMSFRDLYDAIKARSEGQRDWTEWDLTHPYQDKGRVHKHGENYWSHLRPSSAGAVKRPRTDSHQGGLFDPDHPQDIKPSATTTPADTSKYLRGSPKYNAFNAGHAEITAKHLGPGAEPITPEKAHWHATEVDKATAGMRPGEDRARLEGAARAYHDLASRQTDHKPITPEPRTLADLKRGDELPEGHKFMGSTEKGNVAIIGPDAKTTVTGPHAPTTPPEELVAAHKAKVIEDATPKPPGKITLGNGTPPGGWTDDDKVVDGRTNRPPDLPHGTNPYEAGTAEHSAWEGGKAWLFTSHPSATAEEKDTTLGKVTGQLNVLRLKRDLGSSGHNIVSPKARPETIARLKGQKAALEAAGANVSAKVTPRPMPKGVTKTTRMAKNVPDGGYGYGVAVQHDGFTGSYAERFYDREGNLHHVLVNKQGEIHDIKGDSSTKLTMLRPEHPEYGDAIHEVSGPLSLEDDDEGGHLEKVEPAPPPVKPVPETNDLLPHTEDPTTTAQYHNPYEVGSREHQAYTVHFRAAWNGAQDVDRPVSESLRKSKVENEAMHEVRERGGLESESDRVQYAQHHGARDGHIARIDAVERANQLEILKGTDLRVNPYPKGSVTDREAAARHGQFESSKRLSYRDALRDGLSRDESHRRAVSHFLEAQQAEGYSKAIALGRAAGFEQHAQRPEPEALTPETKQHVADLIVRARLNKLVGAKMEKALLADPNESRTDQARKTLEEDMARTSSSDSRKTYADIIARLGDEDLKTPGRMFTADPNRPQGWTTKGIDSDLKAADTRAKMRGDTEKVRQFLEDAKRAAITGEAAPTLDPKIMKRYNIPTDVPEWLSVMLANPDRDLEELKGVSPVDIQRHDAIVTKGNEIAARIDARPDVTAARQRWEEARDAPLPAEPTYPSRYQNGERLSDQEWQKVHDDYLAARGAYSDEVKKRAAPGVDYGDVLRAATQEELRKERDFGGGASAHRIAHEPGADRPEQKKDFIREALSEFPTDWVKASADKNDLTVSKSKKARAFGGKVIHLSSVDPGYHSVVVHEVGHRMEDVVPGITRLERAHIATRTAGQEKSRVIPGYSKDERALEDEFMNPYAGKVYQHFTGNPNGNPNTNHEVLTMGVQSLLGRKRGDSLDTYARQGSLVGIGDVKADPRLRAFTLGLLASHGKAEEPVKASSTSPQLSGGEI